MLLNIKKGNGVSVFNQILNQIIGLIDDGTLEIGFKLPSSRNLAKTIGVNRSTVLRVYDELWAQGYIESSQGSYTKVRKRQQLNIQRNIIQQNNVECKINYYQDKLHLQYDAMMYYIEHGKVIEDEKINFLQISPDTRLLNTRRIRRSLYDALNEKEYDPFKFAHGRGFPPLRTEIARQMKLHNIFAEDGNILITNGTLQSLQIFFHVFSNPNDYIAVENPTSSIILLIAKIFDLKLIKIPMTSSGMDLAVLRKELQQHKIKFIYVMPTYQNPTGISMPHNNREELIQLCKDYDCVILEDGIEEEMKYSGKAFLPIKSIDEREQVVYLGTYTKLMAPGIPLGWVVASTECIKKMTVVKAIFEISSSSINQMFYYKFIHSGAFDLQLRKMVRVYKDRIRVAIAAIKKYIPTEKIEWIEPHGGYLIWIKLLTQYQKNIETLFINNGVLIHNGHFFS